MPSPRRRRLTTVPFPLALATIALAGLVARVAYVVAVRHRAVLGDGPYYHYGAIYLVDGLGFINPLTRLVSGRSVPDALHPPGWTVLLAGPSAIGLKSVLWHQLAACLVGAATIVVIGAAGRVIGGRRVGLIAAGLAAVYPNLWLYERELEAETLVLLAVAVTVLLAYRFRSAPSLAGAIGLGVSVAVLALTRSEMILLAVLLVVPVVLSARGVPWPRRGAWLAAAGVGCAAVIAPWALYNSTRFDRPVPLSTGLGGAMVQGNCPATYHGPRLGFFELSCVFGKRQAAGRDASEIDVASRHEAVEFMRDNAGRVPLVVAAREGRTFGLFRPLQQSRFDTDRNTPLAIIRSGFVAYWLLLALAIAGAVVARRRGVPLYPLLAVPLAVAISVALTIGQTRYRAPAEVTLVLLAALALDAAVAMQQRRRGVAAAVAPDEPAPTAEPVATVPR